MPRRRYRVPPSGGELLALRGQCRSCTTWAGLETERRNLVGPSLLRALGSGSMHATTAMLTELLLGAGVAAGAVTPAAQTTFRGVLRHLQSAARGR